MYFKITSLLLAGLLAAGCVRPAVVRPASGDVLPVLRTLTLGAPAAAICADGTGILVLEASGARVLRFDTTLASVDTIPLTTRIVGPRGIAADRYYVYVYNDGTLYRLQKENPVLAGWLHGARPAGLAGYSPGEMLVSDADRGAIWLKTLFGESRMLLDVSVLPRPGALATLPEGLFAALSGGNVLFRFNRAGIVTDRLELGDSYDLLSADGRGVCYLSRTGLPAVLCVRETGAAELRELGGSPQPAGLAVTGDRLAVLDRDSRLLLYQLP